MSEKEHVKKMKFYIIKNYEEFIKRRDEVQSEDTRATIAAKNILFRRSFDVVWGDDGQILFSERLKDAIEKTGMKETFFQEYGHCPIKCVSGASK